MYIDWDEKNGEVEDVWERNKHVRKYRESAGKLRGGGLGEEGGVSPFSMDRGKCVILFSGSFSLFLMWFPLSFLFFFPSLHPAQCYSISHASHARYLYPYQIPFENVFPVCFLEWKFPMLPWISEIEMPRNFFLLKLMSFSIWVI